MLVYVSKRFPFLGCLGIIVACCLFGLMQMGLYNLIEDDLVVHDGPCSIVVYETEQQTLQCGEEEPFQKFLGDEILYATMNDYSYEVSCKTVQIPNSGFSLTNLPNLSLTSLGLSLSS